MIRRLASHRNHLIGMVKVIRFVIKIFQGVLDQDLIYRFSVPQSNHIFPQYFVAMFVDPNMTLMCLKFVFSFARERLFLCIDFLKTICLLTPKNIIYHLKFTVIRAKVFEYMFCLLLLQVFLNKSFIVKPWVIG